MQAILRVPLLMSRTGDRITGTMLMLNRPWPLLTLLFVITGCVTLAMLPQGLTGRAVAVTLAVTLAVAWSLQTVRRTDAERQLRRAEEGLETSHVRIRDLNDRLLAAQEVERARIARELHDDISQQLAMLHMELHRAGIPNLSLRVANIEQSLRELTTGLYPTVLRTQRLCDALRLMASGYSRTSRIAFVIAGDAPARLPPAVALCLYRVAQESFHNAVKHSRATRVSVDLHWTSAELRLTIADDGIGFGPESAALTGLGFVSITDRVEAVGGRLTISTHSRGTSIQVTVPTHGGDQAGRGRQGSSANVHIAPPVGTLSPV